MSLIALIQLSAAIQVSLNLYMEDPTSVDCSEWQKLIQALSVEDAASILGDDADSITFDELAQKIEAADSGKLGAEAERILDNGDLTALDIVQLTAILKVVKAKEGDAADEDADGKNADVVQDEAEAARLAKEAADKKAK